MPPVSVAHALVAAWNNAPDAAAPSFAETLFVDDEAVWHDYPAWYQPVTGADAIERAVRLRAVEERLVVDDTVVASSKSDDSSTVGLKMHAEDRRTGETVPNSRRLAVVEVVHNNNDSNNSKIARIEWCQEPAWRSGENGLKVLAVASKFIKKKELSNGELPTTTTPSPKQQQQQKSMSPPERYFAAWNARDMDAAGRVFTEDAVYDDTAFPGVLQGSEEIRNHLQRCAAAFPASFQFVVDEIVGKDDKAKNNDNKLMVRWHVENDGEPLPFTRGISFYELQGDRIRRGLDMIDGNPIKTAPLERLGRSLLQKVKQEPVRLVPLTLWVAYLYIVFLSDGILPGANALQLEQRTWEEVRDLSLNFFLVAPILGLPFAPNTVHPALEGVFNLLLSWAALFAGFASDERRDKPNVLPFWPVVLGMQLLTSAFFLPYLATRTTETRDNVTQGELSPPSVATQVTEGRVLGPALGVVGTYSIVWAFVGRGEAFGATLAERWTSFLDLLSIDRVGSSFLVDLAIFGLFQAWLVDDDLKRRGVAAGDLPRLRWVGKYLPFFGLAAYLTLRPSFPLGPDDEEQNIISP